MSILHSLHLYNFRNYSDQLFEFKPGLNVLLGPNGQGKTNVLESIYFLSLLRSFRTNSIQEMKSYSAEKRRNDFNGFQIGAKITDPDGESPHRLSVNYARERQMKIDDFPVKKASEFLGQLTCISFTPDDIELILGQGRVRRRFMDIVLSQLYPGYLTALQNFTRLLKNRNAILKQHATESNKRYLQSFNTVFAREAAALHRYRQLFYQDISKLLEELSTHFYEDPEALTLTSTSNTVPTDFDLEAADFDQLAQAIGDRLNEQIHKEFEMKTALTGPHRDDFSLRLFGKKLKNFGSRGQCRLASLLLEIAASELFFAKEHTSEVIFLVDDVTGELDEQVEARFFELLDKGAQVFFAATELPKAIADRAQQIYHISKGTAASSDATKE